MFPLCTIYAVISCGCSFHVLRLPFIIFNFCRSFLAMLPSPLLSCIVSAVVVTCLFHCPLLFSAFPCSGSRRHLAAVFLFSSFLDHCSLTGLSLLSVSCFTSLKIFSLQIFLLFYISPFVSPFISSSLSIAVLTSPSSPRPVFQMFSWMFLSPILSPVAFLSSLRGFPFITCFLGTLRSLFDFRASFALFQPLIFCKSLFSADFPHYFVLLRVFSAVFSLTYSPGWVFYYLFSVGSMSFLLFPFII